jgi:hypothetical protein
VVTVEAIEAVAASIPIVAPTETRNDVFMVVLHSGKLVNLTLQAKLAAICSGRLNIKTFGWHSYAVGQMRDVFGC